MPVVQDVPDDASLEVTVDLPDEAATGRLGAALADRLRTGDVVGISGPLGVGKTALVRAVVRALGDPDTDVPSPTFTLVQIYDLPHFTLWHFDLYRLERPEDAFELGIEDAFADAVSLFEWPERLGGLLPADALRVDMEFSEADGGRRVRMAGGRPWRDRILAIDEVLSR